MEKGMENWSRSLAVVPIKMQFLIFLVFYQFNEGLFTFVHRIEPKTSVNGSLKANGNIRRLKLSHQPYTLWAVYPLYSWPSY